MRRLKIAEYPQYGRKENQGNSHRFAASIEFQPPGAMSQTAGDFDRLPGVDHRRPRQKKQRRFAPVVLHVAVNAKRPRKICRDSENDGGAAQYYNCDLNHGLWNKGDFDPSQEVRKQKNQGDELSQRSVSLKQARHMAMTKKAIVWAGLTGICGLTLMGC